MSWHGNPFREIPFRTEDDDDWNSYKNGTNVVDATKTAQTAPTALDEALSAPMPTPPPANPQFLSQRGLDSGGMNGLRLNLYAILIATVIVGAATFSSISMSEVAAMQWALLFTLMFGSVTSLFVAMIFLKWRYVLFWFMTLVFIIYSVRFVTVVLLG